MDEKNSLLKLLGIQPSDPVEQFWNNPCGNTLRALGKTKQTEEIVLAAIENDSGRWPFLKYVSKKYLTREVCFVACKKCGLNIRYVPGELIDKEMCRVAIESNPLALRDLPSKFVTIRLCELAIEEDATGAALEYVPARILGGRSGLRLCKLAIEKDKSGRVLGFVPQAMLEDESGHELCRMAVNLSPKAIRFVPDKSLTKEMMLSAVKRDPMAISLLPKVRVSIELANAAVEGTRDTYSRIDSDGQEEIREATDWPIGHIPEHRITRQMVNRSLELCPKSVKGVPERYLSKRICLKLVETDAGAYKYLPQAYLRDNSIIDVALRGDLSNARYVPLDSQLSPDDFESYVVFFGG